MKIAILTQPLRNNYGGNLQNFALQAVLKELGHEPVTVDRYPTATLRSKLKLGYFKRLVLHYLKGAPKPNYKTYFLSKKQQANRRAEISRFIDTHITKTPRLYSDKELAQTFAKHSFGAVIVGSDQAWRPMYSPNIYNYFLDFLKDDANIKKFTYATSFGTDEWEFTLEQTERCKELVQQFDLITVREKAAVNLVKEKFEREAEFVLDPTFLLNKEEYEKLFESRNLPNNKGIYTYILDKQDWKTQVVNTVKSGLALEQFSNQHDERNPSEQKIPSIEGWIKGFADADFVITDSFHGTVFSIIFNKPFISLINVNRGASRFESILSELGLMERLIGDFNEENVKGLLESEIDYEEVTQLLAALKSKSKELLAKELSR